MPLKSNAILWVLILASYGTAFSQLNYRPLIVGQSPITTDENVPVTIPFGVLNVVDFDDNYPSGFSMTVKPGNNYTVNNREVTPNRNYHGRLNVPVSVNDGKDESNTFILRIDVEEIPNVEPVITGSRALTTVRKVPITLLLTDLFVTDPDNLYPDDFTLRVMSGANYTVRNSTVSPDADFLGTLRVRVRVNDGEDESDDFFVEISVVEPPNVRPEITGQATLTTLQATAITIKPGDLIVNDPDNTYPQGFRITLHPGNNYTVNNLTITPTSTFSGVLTVPVSVNDGKDESDQYGLKINVTRVNQKPVITGQVLLSTFVDTPITLDFGYLAVADADNNYPTGFTMTLRNGSHYTFNGRTVTPNPGYVGPLTVRVSVNDGEDESNVFDLEITVNPKPNERPVVNGQDALNTFVDKPITLRLENFRVTDPDNVYPNDFTLKIYPGEGYSFSGTTVTPNASFYGTLTVPITVNDGKAESQRFESRVQVAIVPNKPPTITGQSTVETKEDEPVTITPGMLTVDDGDTPGYPNGFTLKLLTPPANANYTLDGNRVIPAKDYNGTLNVGVSVNDGKDDSPAYNLTITVKPVNDAPLLTGQKVLVTHVTTPVTINISDLTISDPDNTPAEISFRINNGGNYTFDGFVVTPNTNFRGELKVNITITDGTANTNAQVNVRVSDAPNVPPVVEGQAPNPFITTLNTPLAIELTKLIVTDPDNKFPADFKLKVLPGSNYKVAGNTITPANNFLGMLRVPVTVSDGSDDSAPFSVNVSVVAPSARPQIIGQQSLVMNEDETIKIAMADLFVTDTDDVYPKGFKLDILTGSGYSFTGTTVTPVKNLSGFLIVTVKVTDASGKSSDPYGLAILINPIDDAPVITQFETVPLSYEPGAQAIAITTIFDVEDIDNDFLSFAEIGIQKDTYTKGYDALLFSNTAAIRGVFDADSGKLSLIGYAPIAEYRDAIRSVKYAYSLNPDETGKPQTLPKNKLIYVMVHDGQLPSETRTREIEMETAVDLRIPSAFSPNNDRVNETWQVLALTNPQQCEKAVVRVYDKRGVLIFESLGIEKQWDGIFNGSVLPVDTYYYTVDLNLPYAKRTYRGSVTLTR